jgi:ParB family chromosome partitioning protein
MPKTDTYPVQTTGTLVLVHISKIHPNQRNVRSELGDLTDLAASVKSRGVEVPLIAYPHPDDDGHVILIDGHRRWAAAGIAGLEEIPVTLRAVPARAEAVKLMLVTGLHGQDLSPMDKARGFGELADAGMNGPQIAKAIGQSTATVSTYLTLLHLDAASQRRVDRGDVSVADGVAAVRETRAKERKRTGKSDQRETMAATWEPEHFTWQHPLARKAASFCDARRHNARRRLGGAACGVCFEDAIRQDAKVVLLTEMNQQADVKFMPPAPLAHTG